MWNAFHASGTAIPVLHQIANISALLWPLHSYEMWSTNELLRRGHGEDWFRMHLYFNLWDKAFFDDDELETQRSECISLVSKLSKELNGDNRLIKLDFILRDLKSDSDVLTAEEKPPCKGVKANVRKRRRLIKDASYLWFKQARSSALPYHN